MSPRWKPPALERTDAEALRRKKELSRKLEDIVEFGTEEDFVAALKAYNPDIAGKELRGLIMQFRAAVHEKRGLC